MLVDKAGNRPVVGDDPNRETRQERAASFSLMRSINTSNNTNIIVAHSNGSVAIDYYTNKYEAAKIVEQTYPTFINPMISFGLFSGELALGKAKTALAPFVSELPSQVVAAAPYVAKATFIVQATFIINDAINYIRADALKTKIGSLDCYTFNIRVVVWDNGDKCVTVDTFHEGD